MKSGEVLTTSRALAVSHKIRLFRNERGRERNV